MTDDQTRRVGAHVRKFHSLTPFRAQPHAHDPQGVMRLALSESPYGPSEAAIAAARAELDRLNFYPHSDGEPLRTAVAEHYRVDVDQVLVGNGLDELILLVALATTNLAGLGVTTTNTFAGYAASMEIAGQPTELVPLAKHRVDVNAVIAAMRGPGCVMLPNPHNPTAAALSGVEVARLAEAARDAGTVMVFDEAYAEFSDPNPAIFGSGLDQVAGGSVVVLRTFSKAYGLAGLRAGYAIADPAVIAAMLAERNALPYNTNRIALAAATAALGDAAHLRMVVSETRRVRTLLKSSLESRGITVLPSEANFVLADLNPQGPALIAHMAEHSLIHVRDMSGLGYRGWARIGVPKDDGLPAVLDALDRARAAVL